MRIECDSCKKVFDEHLVVTVGRPYGTVIGKHNKHYLCYECGDRVFEMIERGELRQPPKEAPVLEPTEFRRG